MKEITKWFIQLIAEYRRIIESASSTGQSIIKLRRDSQRGRLSYANKRILEFSDLFSVLEDDQAELIDMWYVQKKSSASVAKRFQISRATLYRKRLQIADILYQNRYLFYG